MGSQSSALLTLSFPGAPNLVAGTYTATVELAGSNAQTGAQSAPPSLFIPVNLNVHRVVATLQSDTHSVAIDVAAPTTWTPTTAPGFPFDARLDPVVAWDGNEVIIGGGVTLPSGDVSSQTALYERSLGGRPSCGLGTTRAS